MWDVVGGSSPRAGFTAMDSTSPRRSPDHPRSRGVYMTVTGSSVLLWGSSPLARGLHLEMHSHGVRGRIIPARAGFTTTRNLRDPLGRDHPRSRGVYRTRAQADDPEPGSSPLARGLPPAVRGRVAGAGIIPARAGFTRHPGWIRYRRRDHPRSRGVYKIDKLRLTAAFGSSPLARGLRPALRVRQLRRGIIPARAGFTTAPPSSSPSPSDHPRSRGVYSTRRRPGVHHGGSSPLARGLLSGVGRRGVGCRIIPARAGFTSSSLAVQASSQDHPRSRGVYYQNVHLTAHGIGSSPLARGLRHVVSFGRVPSGIIPARAGFTLSVRYSHGAPSDHPRSRGVYSKPMSGTALIGGIIPARAGFTKDGDYLLVPPEGSSPLARGLR